LKVCTCLIALPSNINSWHGSTKLNTMTFFFSRSPWVHVEHKIARACLTIAVIPPLTPTSKQGYLQKIATIRASLLGSVHRILCHVNALLRHPNISQIARG
jgi:hypothetical protein